MRYVNKSISRCREPGRCPARRGRWAATAATFAVAGASLLAPAAFAAQSGVEVILPAGAGANPQAVMSSVSCASAGNCTAVGDYIDTSGNTQGVLSTETSGTWGPGVEALLPANAGANPQVSVNSVSCVSAGNCSAAGEYLDDSGGLQALLLTETSGTWVRGVEASLPSNAARFPAASLSQVSCISVGNCSAVGVYGTTANPGVFAGLLLTETSGTWAKGVQAPVPAHAGTGAIVQSVSCVSPGNCIAAGEYADNSGKEQGLVVQEISGAWSADGAAPLPANAGSNPEVNLNSVSCVSSNVDCGAVGVYTDSTGFTQGLLLTGSREVTSTGSSELWSGVEAIAPEHASAPDVMPAWVSCASPGDCSAVGQYVDSAGIIQGLLLSEASGTWTAGVQATLPANPNADPHVVLNAVSCASTGDCTAVGAYHDGSGHLQGLLVTQNSGTWGQGVEAALPANAGSSPQVNLATVSCASAGNCVAVHGYIDSSGNGQGLLVTEAGPRPPIHGPSAPPAPPVGPPILEQISGDELVESQPTASPVGLLIQRRGRSRRVVLQLKTPAGIKQLTREAPTFIDVGRIPLGRHHRGRNTIHYELLINGRRLAPGSYVVTLRSLKANKQVLELSQPVTLTINRHGHSRVGKHVLV
jgi:hypothetical protein